MMCSIGIDIGTSTVCGVLVDSQGNSIKTLTKTNDSNVYSEVGWERLQDPERIVGIVLNLIKELSAASSEVKSIGLSGQMHGILYVDRSGKAVSPLYTWQDRRGTLEYKPGVSFSSWLFRESGYSLSSGFGLVTHYFNLINGLVPKQAWKICTIMDYVIMRMCHKSEPKIESSNAASLGFFDCRQRKFDIISLSKVGIEVDILPDVVPSSSVCGYFQSKIPVTVAIGDNQASFMGAVQNYEESVLITIGTSSQISIYTDDFELVNGLDTRPFPTRGNILVGAALCGGRTFALLNEFYKTTV